MLLKRSFGKTEKEKNSKILCQLVFFDKILGINHQASEQ
jgi:hypothetical protein